MFLTASTSRRRPTGSVIWLKAPARAPRASVPSRDSARGYANSGGSRVRTSSSPPSSSWLSTSRPPKRSGWRFRILCCCGPTNSSS